MNVHIAGEVLRARQEATPRRVATIGRLQHFISPAQARRLCAEFNLDARAAWTRQTYGEYGDGFLRAAGAQQVRVIDVSGYEGADVIHDMNEPVAASLHEAFDLVIDGGSIEHVFRPDEALANIMRMVRVGGSAIVWTPANNLCGHGFYQFSPEFFFSALGPRSGFRLATAVVVECVYPSVSLVPARRAYRVRSPREVGTRVGVVSRRPVMLLVRAVKTEHRAEPLRPTPQQSDYEADWAAGRAASAGRLADAAGSPIVRAMRARLRATAVGGAAMRRGLGIAERRRFSLRNRSFFVPLPSRRRRRPRP